MKESKLLANPYAYADRFGRGTEAMLIMYCPRRGRMLTVTKVRRKEDPALYDRLLQALESEDGLHWDSDDKLREKLEETGLLVTPEEMPEEVRFACFLDDDGAELRPRVQAEECPGEQERELQVNPLLRYEDAVEQADAEHENVFLQGYPLAWVQEAGSGISCPYWVRRDWAKYLKGLPAGERPPELPKEVRAALKGSGVLLSAGEHELRQVAWARRLSEARTEFERLGYWVLRGLLPPMLLAATRRYCRDLIARGFIALGDAQCPDRYAKYNEGLAMFFQQQLAGLMQRIVGQPIKPSFVYFCSYRPGASLKKHTDRKPCEFTISLLVDFVPEPEGPSGWPLYLERAEPRPMQAAVNLGLGDALFYKGRELTHYRDPLPEGAISTSFFLHYVPAEFQGSLV